MIVSINGFPPPAEPMKMTVSRNNLYSDSSKRSSETGYLNLYLIAKNKRTIDLEYLLTARQAADLEKLIDGVALEVVFYDGNELVTAVMYPGDPRTKEPVGTECDRRYRLTFQLIER